MILVLAIILFIIFLIYSIRPRKCEEYTLEGLKLSWSNKASIEGIVTKWIVTLKDSSGSIIHTYENSDAGNLKDFTDVTMNIVDKKEFDDKIIGNNTLELYYNEVKPDTKLYTKPVTFTQDDFGMTLDTSNLEEIVPNIDCVGKYIKLKRNKTTEGAERFACGPQNDSDRHYCQFWKHKIETEKEGTGKACSRANNFVIKTQWPTETTASKRIGTPFQNDPNPNTDENVLNNPQYYKKIWDTAPSPITEIPYQIPSATDGWCGHANSVHQDVPGCGRLCSDVNAVGSKNKNTWGSWDKYPGSVDCPAAKLDEVYQFLNGKRSLRVGKYSGTSSPPPPATPTNQDCEGHWINDPTGRSSSKAQKNYKTVKYVVTKPKSGTGKDCMWAFTRKNPHKNATDVTRNWAGYAFGKDQWTSEVVTDGQKAEVFNYQNTKGYRMNDPMHGEEFENMYEWKQNYLRFCMRKPNVAWDYSKNISGRNKDIYTDAYGTTKSLYHQCDDDDD